MYILLLFLHSFSFSSPFFSFPVLPSLTFFPLLLFPPSSTSSYHASTMSSSYSSTSSSSATFLFPLRLTLPLFFHISSSSFNLELPLVHPLIFFLEIHLLPVAPLLPQPSQSFLDSTSRPMPPPSTQLS